MKVTLTFTTERSQPGSPPFSAREFFAGFVRPLTRKGLLGSVALPVLWTVLFYSFVVHVWVILGRWPHFDEKFGGMLLAGHAWAMIGLGLALFFTACYAAPVVFLGSLCFRRWRHVAVYTLGYAAAAAASFGAMHLAPHSFLNWLFD